MIICAIKVNAENISTVLVTVVQTQVGADRYFLIGQLLTAFG